MPRPSKKQNTETPLVEFKLTPNLEDPSKPLIEQTEANESNVIELPQSNQSVAQSNQPIASIRNWSDVDAILADVVSFV